MSDTPAANLIRQYCDGELSPQDAAGLEQRLEAEPDLRAHLEFERRLRDKVAAVMGNDDGDAVPDGLRATITATLADEADEPNEVVSRITREPGETPRHGHRRWWHAPSKANIYAVAATIVLVTSAVLVGILLPPIDEWRPAPDHVAAAAAAVAGEHANAVGPGEADHPPHYTTPGDAASGLADLLGPVGEVFDLREVGYEFLGADRCRVPHCDWACHLFYRRLGSQPGVVSLHVVPDVGQFRLHADESLGLPLVTEVVPETPDCPKDVLVWTHGDRYYMLVVCLAEDAPAVAHSMQNALLRNEQAYRDR